MADDNQVEVHEGASNFQKALAVVFTVLALGYTISPIDFSPDAVPILGWADDALALMTAGVNMVQQFARNQDSFMVKALKYFKWFLVLMVIIAFLLLGGLIAAIVALVTG